MTRRPLATSSDDGATSPGEPVALNHDLQAPDLRRRVTRDGRDERDEEFARLTHACKPSTRRSQDRKGTRQMSKTRTPARPLLTVAEAAERLGTTERFPRRLIAERRITFVKLGSHVRIPEAALDEFIAASTVEAVP
jgi:excisionase family DNA binding protein